MDYGANDGYNTDVKIKMVLNGMGFSGNELQRTVSGFSGGEKQDSLSQDSSLKEPTCLYSTTYKPSRLSKTIMWLEGFFSKL